MLAVDGQVERLKKVFGVVGLALQLRHSFFFQAEDGIRDLIVTGVQTCALPIFTHSLQQRSLAAQVDGAMERMRDRSAAEADREAVLAQQRDLAAQVARLADEAQRERSEERRVGKECRSRWWPYH